jgi:hypothetical protein
MIYVRKLCHAWKHVWNQKEVALIADWEERVGTEAVSATLYNTAPALPFAVTVCVLLLQWNGSNESQILLRYMDFEASGTYACVVSTQTPIYTKPSNEHELTVIRKNTVPAQVVRTANNTTLLSIPFTMQ